MPNGIFEAFKKIDCVEAIALGGSRTSKVYDENSDYDVYVYVTDNIDETIRKEVLSKYCSYIEIGNHFWEYEDNCVLNSGIDIDILYRNLNSFCEKIENVVVHCQAANAYTTCMWHNLINCVILYDKNGRLEAAKRRFNVPYPKKLKKAIIKRQIQLMDSAMPAYKVQISKAVKRGDLISVNHRVTEFLASYFDLLFALNEKTHIGEKRLVEWCKNNCMILPEYFEQNINNLFCHMYCENQSIIINDVNRIIECVKKVIKNEIEE